MDERRLLQEITADLQKAPARKVLYLEGKTDPPVFFALLGLAVPTDPQYPVCEGVLVRGLTDRGTGGDAVRQRVEVAHRRGYPGIYGVVDGDGRSLGELAAAFDPPFPGPLFRWKGYSIESLLVKTGWPATWGTAPASEHMLRYEAYVALNRVFAALRGSLETLGLARYHHPSSGDLLTAAQVRERLQQDRHLIAGRDVAGMFDEEVARYRTAMESSLDEAHCLVDGKWLVKHMAPERIQRTPERCRSEWIDHAIAAGGLPEVRGLWQRIFGHPGP
jgi:hypothetical protein